MIEIWCPEMLATEKHGNIDLHYSIGGLKNKRQNLRRAFASPRQLELLIDAAGIAAVLSGISELVRARQQPSPMPSIAWRAVCSLDRGCVRLSRGQASGKGGPILFPLYVWCVVVTQAIYTYIIYISIPSL